MKKIFALFIAIIGFSIIAFSQTYTMSNSTVTTCSGTFYDPGGTGNYADNQNVTMTFCSGNGQSVLLQFSQFALENNWDYLYIYNGPSTASPLIGTYTGTNNPGTVVGTSGCITVRFTSDGSITAAGFTAAISCSTPPPPPTGTTVNFTCTAGSQNWVVPPCVTSINVVVEGAQGGGGANGGLGAVVTTSLAVIPGQTLIVSVGCVGFCPTGTTFGGGGNGQTANMLSNASCDGGGASSISLGASSLVVAAGGGGMGGGTQNGAGGIGGCLTGSIGGTSFGNGATGGTQTAGGIGGSPWIPSGNTGQNGSFGQGGYGATDPCFNQGPGGGGGGGYYGGAGGGSDCFDFGSMPGGGGGGGGGSSFIPAGGGCSAGSNSGPGVVSINYTIGTVTMIPEPNLTVCSGNTVPINTFVSTPTGATFTWTNSNTAIGLAASGTTSVPAFAATNSTLGPITATISITPTLAGCVGAPITYTITVNPIPTVTVTNATVCNGTSATLTATGLATGGTFLWSTGATTASITASPSATTAYTVVYTLAGCSSLTATGTITVNPIPTVTVTNATVCNGTAATLTATGLATGGTFLWSSGATTASITATPTNTTAYTVVYTLAGCASLAGTGTITVNPIPTVTVTNATVCNGTAATLTATGLAAGGTFLWSSGATTASITATPTNTTAYTVVYTLAGCSSLTATGTITVNPIPTVTVTNATVCNGTSATLTATGLATGGTFLWSSGATTASITATPTNTTAYTVVYTLAGCASLAGTGTITVNPVPIVGLIDTAICAGESIFVNGTEFNATTIGATEVFIVGSQGCDSTVTINLIVNPLPNLSAVANPDTILIGDTAQLIANGTGSFEWNNGQSGATIGVNPEETMSFSVMLVDLNGCVSENAVPVYVLGASEDLISIPSGFSPNGDGINDIFRVIVNGSFDDVELAIYNRWGELLHKKNGLATHGWDGTYKSKGQPLGTYAYKVVVKTRTGEEFNLIGNVTLIR